MADHSKPLTTSTYTNFVTELDSRLDDITKGLNTNISPYPTNLPNGAIRWNSITGTNRWEKYTSSTNTWAALTSLYDISISGNAVTADTADRVVNNLTFTTGNGASSSSTYNGSASIIIGCNTIGAAPDEGATTITKVGTIAEGTWQGNTIATTYTAAKVTSIVAGTGITVSSGVGAVTVSLPQAISTSSAVTFNKITLNNTTGNSIDVNNTNPSGYLINANLSSGTALNLVTTIDSASGVSYYFKTLTPSPTVPSSGDILSQFRFIGKNASGTEVEYAHWKSYINTTNAGVEVGETKLVNKQTGALQTAFHIIGNTAAYIPAAYTATTASAANTYVGSTGLLQRSTSSIRYKTQVEDLESSSIIYKLRPVWYRSTIPSDRQDWSWYGLIAEEVAELDPRLVHWGYAEDQYTIKRVYDGTEYTEEKTLVNNPVLRPEGVQYDRLTVLLIKEIQKLEVRLAKLET